MDAGVGNHARWDFRRSEIKALEIFGDVGRCGMRPVRSPAPYERRGHSGNADQIEGFAGVRLGFRV